MGRGPLAKEAAGAAGDEAEEELGESRRRLVSLDAFQKKIMHHDHDQHSYLHTRQLESIMMHIYRTTSPSDRLLSVTSGKLSPSYVPYNRVSLSQEPN